MVEFGKHDNVREEERVQIKESTGFMNSSS